MSRNAIPSDQVVMDKVEGRSDKSPDIMLAQHVNEAFGTRISAEQLKRFITENWWTVQRLAHRIHENEERWKKVQETPEPKNAEDGFRLRNMGF